MLLDYWVFKHRVDWKSGAKKWFNFQYSKWNNSQHLRVRVVLWKVLLLLLLLCATNVTHYWLIRSNSRHSSSWLAFLVRFPSWWVWVILLRSGMDYSCNGGIDSRISSHWISGGRAYYRSSIPRVGRITLLRSLRFSWKHAWLSMRWMKRLNSKYMQKIKSLVVISFQVSRQRHSVRLPSKTWLRSLIFKRWLRIMFGISTTSRMNSMDIASFKMSLMFVSQSSKHSKRNSLRLKCNQYSFHNHFWTF